METKPKYYSAPFNWENEAFCTEIRELMLAELGPVKTLDQVVEEGGYLDEYMKACHERYNHFVCGHTLLDPVPFKVFNNMVLTYKSYTYMWAPDIAALLAGDRPYPSRKLPKHVQADMPNAA